MNKKENEIPMNVEIEQVEIEQKEILVIDKDYGDIFSCIEESGEIIYRKMIEVYEKIIDSNDNLTLCVLFMVNGYTHHADYPINKVSSELIISVIIPYMEKIEDYGFCQKAINIYRQINR
jgi:hypothetical protein